MRRENRSERGASQLLVLVVMGALLLGGVLGVGGRLASLESSGGTLALTPVGYAACPGGSEIGQFHRGDRVLSTGRNKVGNWLEVRDPGALGSRVWVEAKFVVPDGATNGLPVRECAATATTPTAPTALTTPTTATAPTTQPGSPALPGPGGGPGGGGPGGSGGVADTTGPHLDTIGASPGEIWEHNDSLAHQCSSTTTSVLSVPISDPSGVSSASFTWSYPGHSGSGSLSNAGGTWTGTLGRFDEDAIPDFTVYDVTVTVTAVDRLGNSSTRSRTVKLHSSDECNI